MTVALNVYGTNAASSDLSTAGLLVNVTGASGNSTPTTKCGTATGFSNIPALGTTNAWQALGAIGLPDGTGWLYDVTSLEGQQIISGTWTPKVRHAVSVGTATADMYMVAYVYNVTSQAYTQIGTCSLTGQNLTTTITNYTFGGNTLPAQAFGPGDKLYLEEWHNLTANSTGSSSATIKSTPSNSATLGRAANMEVDTPGYITQVSSTITLTTAGLNLLRDGNAGANSPKITYVALGTSNAAPSSNDTKLGNEVFRKAVTSYVDGSTGQVVVSMYLAPGDAVGDDIEEIGFFGGTAASALANTGVLVAHGLYSHNPKVGTESIQIQMTIQYNAS